MYNTYTMIKEIGFVCYPVVDMARARKFYESVLGLVPSEEFSSGEWVEYAVGSGTLSLGKMEGWNPVTDGANL
ncbi:MAG: VOC family protein, partial [Candidatus Paceibacterota bacterium]